MTILDGVLVDEIVNDFVKHNNNNGVGSPSSDCQLSYDSIEVTVWNVGNWLKT